MSFWLFAGFCMVLGGWTSFMDHQFKRKFFWRFLSLSSLIGTAAFMGTPDRSIFTTGIILWFLAAAIVSFLFKKKVGFDPEPKNREGIPVGPKNIICISDRPTRDINPHRTTEEKAA